MSGQLFRRLERFRKQRALSILKLCKEIGCNNVTYHRWKKTGQITGPYKKIVDEFLDKGESSSSKSPSPIASDIAITGLACYYPGAVNIKELWENILARRVQFRRMLDGRLPVSDYYDPDPKSSEKTYITKAALIEGFVFDWSKRRIPRKTFESTDVVHWLALDTALRALEDAGYKLEDMPKENTGVIVGNTLTGEQTRSQTLRLRWPFVKKTLDVTLAKLGLQPQERQNIEAAMEGIYKSAFYPITEDSLAGGLANTIAGRICNYLNFKGGGYIVDGACSSSLLAVVTAANALKNGELDIALAGGVDISLDPFELVGFARAGALAKDKMCVYDRNASGFIPGEGCGFAILKRLEDAVRDGNYIYAVVKGWGISSDGRGGIMEPSTSGQALAIERAYKNVPYKITDIDFVEGHGTGTAKGDRVELEGIATAMANEAQKDLKRIYGITSFKSIVGHTKAAAGIGGFIKAVLAVNQRILPPTANCRQPNEIFEGSGKCLYPVTQGVILDAAKPVRGGISSAGFGGINCHVAIESKDRPKQELKPSVDERALLVSNQETEVFVFASPTVSLLKNLIGKFKDDLRFISQAEMADLSARLTRNIKKNAPLKVAVVTDSPENLYQALCLIEGELSKDIPEGEILKVKSPNLNTYILLSNKAQKVHIGFLYPGQASQRLNMTRVLFERFAWARDLAAITKIPISQYIYKPLDQLLTAGERSNFEKELSRTEITQPAVTFSSLVWTEFLARLGIEPDAVGGHSLGELSAFYKAGAFTKDELLKFAEFRGQTMAASGKDKGAMASLGCPRSKAEELIRRVRGNLVAANINSPVQTVISGDKLDIEKVIKEAKKEDIAGVLLPVSNAFHSPFMKESCARIKGTKILSRSFKPSRTALYSCMDGKQLIGPVLLNEYFSQQVISPVKFIDLVASMSKECDLLIEVGPGRVLADLVKAINKENGPACLSVESTVGNDMDLNLVLAELFVRNVCIRWEEVYKNRLIRPFVPVFKRKFVVNQCERPLKVPEDMGKIPVVHEKTIQAVIQSMVPSHAGESASQSQSSQESLAPSNGRVSDTLIHFVEKLTGFHKDSIQLNLRLLDDLNLDSIKAAELIAEVAKSLGVAGEIEPARYSNKTLEEIRQKFEELLQEKGENKPHKVSQQDILKRYVQDAWVRNFMEKFEPETVKDKNPDILKSFKGMLVVCGDSERAIAGKLKEGLKDIKVRVVTADEVNIEEKPEGIIDILPSGGQDDFSKANLHQVMGRLYKTIGVAANSRYVLFAQLGSGDFKSSNIRALASTLHLERPDLRLKIMDFNQTLGSQFIADKIQEELQSDGTFAIAGYTAQGKRQVPVFEVSNPASYQARNIHWSKKDVVLVTGGAKGITAECALEFARTTQAKMVLLGRSAKDEEIEKTLKRFKTEKLTCEYLRCDVTDADQVKQVIGDVEKRLGPITAVIHGAGLNNLRRLKQAGLEDVYKEALPKVMGAVHVLEALEGRLLKLFAAMASIIGVTGMEGSGWYGFANEILIQYLRQYKKGRKNIEIIAPAFSVWDDVGMGVKLGSVAKLSERGIGAIPVAEGVKRFKDLVEKDPGVEQVIITSRVPGLDTLRLREFKPSQGWRFVEDIKYCLPGVELIAQAHLNIKDDPYLLDHNWKGTLLFPMVFGLEAMIQAAVCLTNRGQFDCLRISDIHLDKPIPVNQDSGARIEIHAEALEPKNRDEEIAVKVKIFSEHDNFSRPAFSAVVAIAGAGGIVGKNIITRRLAGKTIDIDLEQDVYGRVLFQGRSFHCINRVHELFYDENKGYGECVLDVECNKSAQDFLRQHPKFSSRFLIGDPFLIDSLLQSMQIIVSQEACLPSYIDEIFLKIITSPAKQTLLAKSNVRKISKNTLQGDAFIKPIDGRFLAIKGCQLKILDHSSDKPSANDLANPTQRDQKIIDQELVRISKEFSLIPPIIRCQYYPELKKLNKSERHQAELPLIKVAVEDVLRKEKRSGKSKDIKIHWSKSGKPIVAGKITKDIGISLSHNGNLLLCIAGLGDQGCDVEMIEERNKENWLALLGKKYARLLEQLTNVTGNQDLSGTAIWSAIEVNKKTINSQSDFTLAEVSGERILLNDPNQENNFIVIIPIKLTNLKKRIISFHQKNLKLESNLGKSNQDLERQIFFKKFGFNEEVFGIQVDCSGPQQQFVFSKQFPVTFRTNKLLSRRVFFTNYFEWMGELREYSIQPMMGELAMMLETGGWGIATNLVKLQILGDLRGNDVVVGRVWMEEVSGHKESTFDLCFEWRKQIPDNQFERVAFCKQRVTWIKITGHGQGKVEGLPEPIKGFMDSMRPRTKEAKPLERLPEPFKYLNMGEGIEDFSDKNLFLMDYSFDTSLENSNLVGNVYFANYAEWLGVVTDLYFYRIIPTYYKGIGINGEFICLNCEIDYLSEAMPFDRILLKMYLNKTYQNGMDLNFEFFLIKEGKAERKLAVARHKIIWIRREGEAMETIPLPAQIIERFKKELKPILPTLQAPGSIIR